MWIIVFLVVIFCRCSFIPKTGAGITFCGRYYILRRWYYILRQVLHFALLLHFAAVQPQTYAAIYNKMYS